MTAASSLAIRNGISDRASSVTSVLIEAVIDSHLFEKEERTYRPLHKTAISINKEEIKGIMQR